MRLHLSSIRASAVARRHEAAFTVAEMVVASGVFLLLITGVIYGYIFGLNLMQITQVKLGATDDARKVVIRLTDEIRSSYGVRIGSGNLTNFVENTNGIQTGIAIQIQADSSSNTWVRYWYETN